MYLYLLEFNLSSTEDGMTEKTGSFLSIPTTLHLYPPQ